MLKSSGHSFYINGVVFAIPCIKTSQREETTLISFRQCSQKLFSFVRYQVLAVATETKTKEDAQKLKSGKKVAVIITNFLTDLHLKTNTQCLYIAYL